MTRRFAKYEGLGNDFVVIDAPDSVTASDAIHLCDRRRGIGADGVLLLSTSAEHDTRMQVINADGSTPEMCGNGIRCVALHLALARDIDRADMTITTDAGPRLCRVTRKGTMATVRVDMGVVRFIEDRELHVEGRLVRVAIADAGNPHAIVFGDHIDQAEVDVLGPAIAKDASFANGTNVEFASVHDTGISLVVWERGVGRTLACGTGACATAVVARKKGLTRSSVVRVALPGGDLEIEPGADGATFMTGPAKLVFRGETSFEVEP